MLYVVIAFVAAVVLAVTLLLLAITKRDPMQLVTPEVFRQSRGTAYAGTRERERRYRAIQRGTMRPSL